MTNTVCETCGMEWNALPREMCPRCELKAEKDRVEKGARFLHSIHGFRIIGYVMTGRRDGDKEARIILVDRGAGHHRFVVAFHWTGEEGWSDGFYTDSFSVALNDFWLRVVRESNLRPT